LAQVLVQVVILEPWFVLVVCYTEFFVSAIPAWSMRMT